MTTDSVFALLVGVVLFSVEVTHWVLAFGQNLEMHYFLLYVMENECASLSLSMPLFSGDVGRQKH